MHVDAAVVWNVLEEKVVHSIPDKVSNIAHTLCRLQVNPSENLQVSVGLNLMKRRPLSLTT